MWRRMLRNLPYFSVWRIARLGCIVFRHAAPHPKLKLLTLVENNSKKKTILYDSNSISTQLVQSSSCRRKRKGAPPEGGVACVYVYACCCCLEVTEIEVRNATNCTRTISWSKIGRWPTTLIRSLLMCRHQMYAITALSKTQNPSVAS